MPSINDIPRRVIRAKDPVAKNELDIGLRLPQGASPFSVAVWGMTREKQVEQSNEVEVEEVVNVEESSLDGKSSMNALFSMFTQNAKTTPTAASTPLDEAPVKAEPVATVEPILPEPVVVTETVITEDVPAVAPVEASVDVASATSATLDAGVNQAVVLSSGIEQLSFDVIPAAPVSEPAEKPKAMKRVAPELARKIRLVNKALSFVGLFNEAEAPIPETANGKPVKKPVAEAAREALAELLGMKQKDEFDGLMDALAQDATDTTQPAQPASDSPSV